MKPSFTFRSAVLLIIAALHVALLTYAALSARHETITPPQTPPVVMAQLIPQPVVRPATPPAPPIPKSKPQVVTPRPPTRPVVRQRAETPIRLTEKVSEQPAPAIASRADSAPPAPAAPEAPPAPAAPSAPAPVAVTPPRFNAAYLNNPPPAYPPLARRMGDEGKVMLRVFVTPEGTAGEVRVLTSSGSPMFDDAAMAAVRQWRFVPARQGDNAVAAWVQVPIVFKLG
ncbi:MAG: energy transducer TonB [Herminiimonas sp.]|nr:energy transducer TonB [Herminiimonas sp.]